MQSLKFVWGERPRLADLERQRELCVLRLAEEMLVELPAALRPKQVIVSMKLCGNLTL